MAIETASPRRSSRWRWLVAASAGLVLLAAAVLAAWWAVSRETRIASYEVRGNLEAIALDLDTADTTIVGAGGRGEVGVRHVESFAFGRPAQASRGVAGGVLRISSRCPAAVLSPCSVSYRLTVPDNVPLSVRTSSGDVRFDGFRGTASVESTSGEIVVGGYCGFSLSARTDTGNVSAGSSCAPERLELRSQSGDVRAVVPSGRYDVEAEGAESVVRGVEPSTDSPFAVTAVSESGNVTVEAAP